MKKTIRKLSVALIVITVLSLLTAGCSSGNNNINTEQNAVTYVENKDYQYFIDSSSAFAKVDNGYYFLNE